MSDAIFTHAYDNGLVLAAQRMPWLRSAAFTLLVPGGSVHESADRCGLASLLSEMLDRGAGPRDSRQLVIDLDNLGVDRSGFVSAAHTGLGGAAPAENLAEALRIHADILRRPHLDETQIEPSRASVLHELRGIEDEPAQKTMLALRRRHYAEPWGRPSQGERDALLAANLDDIRTLFRRRYRPDGTILGVAGKFDFPALRDLVGELFDDWPIGEPESIDEQPPTNGYQHLPYDSQQTHIGIAYQGIPYRHPDYFQAWGATGVLSGGMSARLFTEVRERRGLCYSVHASYHTLRDRAAVFCHAGTTADRAQQTLDVTLAELRRLAEGVRDDELARLKARMKSGLIMQQESSSARSSAIARDWYHLGRIRPVAELQSLVDGLTPASVNAYLAESPPTRFTVVTLGPEPLEVPRGVS